jgi:peptidoglycan/LPS O-acetylase OafA/YrhL
MAKQDKIISIQYLRGIASLGVVLCHYGSNTLSHPLLSKFFNFGQAGVYVFFFISGFIIVYSLNKLNYRPQYFFTFLLKRSIRIDPTYFVVIILTLLLFKGLSYCHSFKGEKMPFIPGQLLAHIFYVIPFTKYPFYNRVFWTLCVEFQFYLLIGLLYFLSGNFIYKSIFLILFSLTFLIPLPNGYNFVFNYAPIFAFGISLVNVYENKTRFNIVFSVLMSILIGYKFGLPIFGLIIASSLCIFFLKINIKPLIFLGDISYSLYLIHVMTLVVFNGIAKKLNFDIGHYELLWIILKVSIAIISAYILYIIIEKPSLSLSKRVFYHRR